MPPAFIGIYDSNGGLFWCEAKATQYYSGSVGDRGDGSTLKNVIKDFWVYYYSTSSCYVKVTPGTNGVGLKAYDKNGTYLTTLNGSSSQTLIDRTSSELYSVPYVIYLVE